MKVKATRQFYDFRFGQVMKGQELEVTDSQARELSKFVEEVKSKKRSETPSKSE